MLKIALTGADGLIGSRIIELLGREFHFIPLSREMMDITNFQQVENAIQETDFDIFLHLAAYTDVDGAEKNKQIAYKINVEGTKNVFNQVLKKKKKFIYISTDFVFDGSNPPYDEESQPHPICYYGQTKYEGEKIVKGEAMIIRLSYPYRAKFEKKKDFVRTLKSLLEEGKIISMVTDMFITPTFIDDIAYALKYLLKNYSPEIFHLVGGNSLTPYEAATFIAKNFNLNPSLIHSTTYEQYSQNRAKRPQFNKVKSKKNNFYQMKTFEEGLEKIKFQISNRK